MRLPSLAVLLIAAGATTAAATGYGNNSTTQGALIEACQASESKPEREPSGGKGIELAIGEPIDGAGLSLVGWRQPCEAAACTPAAAYPTVAVTGFFQADALWFAQDAASTAVVGDVQDVADFRRARLAAKGKVAENVDYFMEYDFAFPGRPSFMDVYLDLADVSRVGRLRVGQWRQPLGMEAQTSVRELVFLERALPFAFVPFRQIGVGLYDTAADERVTWAISAYRFPTDVFGDVVGDAGYGFSTRETLLLYDGGDATIHVGGGYSYNRPSTAAVRLRSSPEVGFNQLDFRSTDFPVPFFVDTGPVAADGYQLLNAELAASRGPLLAQTEFYGASVHPTVGGSATLHGAYAQLAYVLTSETHPYNKSAGVYSRVVPESNYGPCGVGHGKWRSAGATSTCETGRSTEVSLRT